MVKVALLVLLLLSDFVCLAQDANDEMTIQLEQRLNDLTNQIEQINHKYNLLLKKFESLSADVEFRFKEIGDKKNITKVAEVIKKPGDPKLAKIEFDNAYALLKEQKYQEAELALEGFLKSYPNNEYTGPAYYWLGESFILRKRYDKAAVNYILSFSKFPKNNKADLSMLKLYSALNKLGKKKEACDILAKLKVKMKSLSPPMQKLLQKEMTQGSCK